MLRLGRTVIKGGAGGSQSGFVRARGHQVSGLSGVSGPADMETQVAALLAAELLRSSEQQAAA